MKLPGLSQCPTTPLPPDLLGMVSLIAVTLRLKYIDNLTVEMEEEIYFTKISYIEPIFEGGLQVILSLVISLIHLFLLVFF